MTKHQEIGAEAEAGAEEEVYGAMRRIAGKSRCRTRMTVTTETSHGQQPDPWDWVVDRIPEPATRLLTASADADHEVR
jgi:hypothetical protein